MQCLLQCLKAGDSQKMYIIFLWGMQWEWHPSLSLLTSHCTLKSTTHDRQIHSLYPYFVLHLPHHPSAVWITELPHYSHWRISHQNLHKCAPSSTKTRIKQLISFDFCVIAIFKIIWPAVALFLLRKWHWWYRSCPRDMNFGAFECPFCFAFSDAQNQICNST